MTTYITIFVNRVEGDLVVSNKRPPQKSKVKASSTKTKKNCESLKKWIDNPNIK